MLKYFLFLVLTPFICFAQINGPGDTQIWQRINFQSEISERLTFKLTEETRYGDDVSKFYYSYLQFNAAFQPRKWLSIEPGYRQIYKRTPLSSDKFRAEYDPLVDLFLKYQTDLWSFKNRNRIQLLLLGSNKNWLYRTLFHVRRKIENVNLSVYLENEFFFREFNDYTQNRTTFGLSKSVYDYFTIDCFYIARLLKNNNNWAYNNVVGFNLNFSI